MAQSVKKRALVIRYGGIGDTIIYTPVLKKLKEDGYHVTVEVKEIGAKILKHNPYVDKVILHTKQLRTDDEFGLHWAEISKGFDKVINLSSSIEADLVFAPWQADAKLPAEERREKCNVNFYDHTMKVAGYPDSKGELGKMYFSAYEKQRARDYMHKHRKKFVVLWGLTGSGLYKVWPYTEYVALAFLRAHPDAIIITTGEPAAMLLEWDHPQTINTCGNWEFRRTAALIPYTDLIIGPDTGLMHAASGSAVDKILLLTGNTIENISKYWRNTVNIEPNRSQAPCHPCHLLHYSMGTCTLDEKFKSPICMTKLSPETVLREMESKYKVWKGRR